MSTRRFNTATSKLITAFVNGKLTSGACTKCAVGNICDNRDEWSILFMTNENMFQQNFIHDDDNCNPDTVSLYYRKNYSLRQLRELAFHIIEATGYTADQLAKIEYLFETTVTHYHIDVGKTEDEAQFYGLCVVIDKLAEFDNIELSEVNNTKSQLLCHEQLSQSLTY